MTFMMKTAATLLLLCVLHATAFSPSSQIRPSATTMGIVSQSSQRRCRPFSSQQQLHAFFAKEETTSTQNNSTSGAFQFQEEDAAGSLQLLKGQDFLNDQDFLQSQQPVEAELVMDGDETDASGLLESLAWRGVIVVLCALWASNFAAAKMVMAEPGVDSSLYALARFGVSATALAPFAVAQWKRANIDAELLQGALKCGSWVAFGYLGQTVGLMTTTASKSCVICSMHCVFVAAIAELWRVQRSTTETSYDVKRLIPAVLAVIGVAIIELRGAGGAPTIGDALSFAQPVGFGMGYLILEDLMRKNPAAALPVSALKLAVVAVASFGMFELSPLIHGGGVSDLTLAIPDFSPILASPMALGGIMYTGLVTTAFALWIESIAFAKVPATDASIILTTEPLIAAGLGAVVLGETFGVSDYVGASLIVGACAVAVLMENNHEKPVPADIQ